MHLIRPEVCPYQLISLRDPKEGAYKLNEDNHTKGLPYRLRDIARRSSVVHIPCNSYLETQVLRRGSCPYSRSSIGLGMRQHRACMKD